MDCSNFHNCVSFHLGPDIPASWDLAHRTGAGLRVRGIMSRLERGPAVTKCGYRAGLASHFSWFESLSKEKVYLESKIKDTYRLKCPHQTRRTGSCCLIQRYLTGSWCWLSSVAWRASTDADRCAGHGMPWSCGTSGRDRAKGVSSKWFMRKTGVLMCCHLMRIFPTQSG